MLRFIGFVCCLTPLLWLVSCSEDPARPSGGDDVTGSTPPHAVADLEVSEATETSATLAWTAPDPGSAPIAFYELRYSYGRVQLPVTPEAFRALPLIEIEPTAAPGQRQTFEWSDLERGATHYILLRAVNGAGLVSSIADLAVYLEHPWLQDPPAYLGSFRLGIETEPSIEPVGLAVATDSRIFVADAGTGRIHRYGQDGGFQTAWGERITDEGNLASEPVGMAGSPDGERIYVLEAAGTLHVFHRTGVLLKRWRAVGGSDTVGRQAGDLVVDLAGTIHVADHARSRILSFAPDGTVLGSWGEFGTGPGQLLHPTGLAITEEEDLLVTDEGNRVQGFTLAGGFLFMWGSEGSGPGQFQSPEAVAVAPGGRVFVADRGNARIQVWDPDGTYRESWTGIDGMTQAVPFGGPLDVAVASNRVLVLDSGLSSLSTFSLDGVYLRGTGGPWGRATRLRCLESAGSGTLVGLGDLDPSGEPYNFHVVSLGEGPRLGGNVHGRGFFRKIAGISATVNGVLVTDAGNARVVEDSADGFPIWAWGSHTKSGTGLGYALEEPVAAVRAGTGILVADPQADRLVRFQRTTAESQILLRGVTAASVDLDAEGRIYVTNPDAHTVVQFAADGVVLDVWGTLGTGQTHFDRPVHVAVTGETLFVTEAGNHRVQALTLDGRFVTMWGEEGDGPGQFRAPRSLAIGPSGELLVLDSERHEVQRFRRAPR